MEDKYMTIWKRKRGYYGNNVDYWGISQGESYMVGISKQNRKLFGKWNYEAVI